MGCVDAPPGEVGDATVTPSNPFRSAMDAQPTTVKIEQTILRRY
jgi:hypothetical protein